MDAEISNVRLLDAIRHGDKEIVLSDLSQGADVDGIAEDDRTHLLLAARYGHTDIVRFLLEHGIDIEAKGNDGYTALMWASWSGHIEIAQILLKAGADINVINNDTALSIAKKEGQAEVMDLLMSAIKKQQLLKSISAKVPEHQSIGLQF